MARCQHVSANGRSAPNGSVVHLCPECLCGVLSGPERRVFCSPAHKKAWDNRQRLRGRQLFPFAAVARVTRGGTRGNRETGHRAQADQDMLLGRWNEEDARDNRMSQSDYLTLLYHLGFDRP